MARVKKTTETNASLASNELAKKLDIIRKASKKSNDFAGETVMGILGESDELQEKLKIKFYPFPSEDLNEATGGGFPKGKITLIYGLEDSGKTTLMLESIGKNMALDPNLVACWIETEKSLEAKFLTDVCKIDLNRFVYKEISGDMTAEETINEIEGLIRAKAINICVINSLKMLIPQIEITKKMEDVVVAEQARFNSRMMKKLTGILDGGETALVLINHLTTSIGGGMPMRGGELLVGSGGKAIRYAAMLMLDLRSASINDSDPITKEEGKKIAVTIKKNHCVPHRNPYVKTYYYAVFGEGTEQVFTTLAKAIERGIMVQRGAWIFLVDENGELSEENKWNGKRKFREDMIEHPEKLDMIKALIGKTYQDMTKAEITELEKQEKEDSEESDALMEAVEAAIEIDE